MKLMRMIHLVTDSKVSMLHACTSLVPANVILANLTPRKRWEAMRSDVPETAREISPSNTLHHFQQIMLEPWFMNSMLILIIILATALIYITYRRKRLQWRAAEWLFDEYARQCELTDSQTTQLRIFARLAGMRSE